MYESNKIEIDKRILLVSKMLLKEFSTSKILHFASRIWGISDRQTKTYIRRCYTLWHQDFQKKRKAGLDHHLAKRRDLYEKAYNYRDWKECLEIAKDEAKLMGIYPTENKNIDLNIKGELEVNSELDKKLAQLDIKDLIKLSKLNQKLNADKRD